MERESDKWRGKERWGVGEIWRERDGKRGARRRAYMQWHARACPRPLEAQAKQASIRSHEDEPVLRRAATRLWSEAWSVK